MAQVANDKSADHSAPTEQLGKGKPARHTGIGGPQDARCCILTYHEVVPAQASYLYSVTSGQLEEHLQLVAELQAAARPVVVAPRVTFDDGYVSNHQYALPLLEQYSVRAIFFVTAGWIGKRPGIMSWAQLREITTLGHEVESHSWSHKFLTHCSDSELREEMRRSKHTLEDKLGVVVDAISAPGGRFNRRALAAAAMVGYRRVYVSNPWMNPAEQSGVRVLGRLMVQNGMNAQQLQRLFNLRGAPLLWRRTQYQLKEILKSALGDAVYQRMWRFLAQHDRSDGARLAQE